MQEISRLSKSSPTKKLAVGAIMIALATVLSMFAVFKLPNGGSVTIASMAPIILFSLMFDFKWSALVSVAYAGLQMLLGFYPPPVQDFMSFLIVIMLDYVVAFGVLCLAGPIARAVDKAIKKPFVSSLIGTFVVVAARFVCHFLSGITVWASYCPEDQPLWLYSLAYNGSYMGCECVITVAVIAMLFPAVKRIAVSSK